MLTGKRLIFVALLVGAVVGFVVYPKLKAAPTVSAGTPVAATAASGNGQQAPAGGKPPAGGSGIAVLTAVAAKEDVPISEDAIGWVEPIATVALRSRMDGIIVEQDVQEGAIVKPGDVLFRLDLRALR